MSVTRREIGLHVAGQPLGAAIATTVTVVAIAARATSVTTAGPIRLHHDNELTA